MTATLDDLSQAKHLSSEEIATLVRDLTTRYSTRGAEFREAFDRGKLFRIGPADDYGKLAIETALVALILANVSVHDPLSRKRQIESITAACSALGVSYQEALQLTSSEEQIKQIFGVAH